MKRLFIVKDKDGKPVMDKLLRQPVYFEKKSEAKQLRDRMDGATISYGPDHWRHNQE